MRSRLPGSRRLPDTPRGDSAQRAVGTTSTTGTTGDAAASNDDAALSARIERREREHALDDAVFNARFRQHRQRAGALFWIALAVMLLGGGVHLVTAPGWGAVTLGGICLLVMGGAKVWGELCPRCRRLIGYEDQPRTPERFCQHCSLPLDESPPDRTATRDHDGIR